MAEPSDLAPVAFVFYGHAGLDPEAAVRRCSSGPPGNEAFSRMKRVVAYKLTVD